MRERAGTDTAAASERAGGDAGASWEDLPAGWRQAFRWVERTVGGRVVRWERQPRWRPAWFLDVERDGTTVPLYWRGARGALDHGISDLRYEMGVLEVLEAHGIPVPHVYGWCPEPEGLLLERRSGRTELTDADSDAERVAVLDHYVEILAQMHAIPVEAFEAKGLRRPETAEEVGLGDFDKWERVYRATKRRPAPMEEFGIRWIRRNVPRDRTDVCFVAADCGQFLYEHGRVTTVFDLEFSYLGDRAAELAGLRIRDAAHKLGDVRRALRRYAGLTGTAIDPAVVDYHTVRFAWVNPLSLGHLCADPPPEINYVQYQAWYVLCSRWGLDVLARRVLGRDAPGDAGRPATADPPPVRPPATPSGRAPAFAALVTALDPSRADGDRERAYELETQQRVARYLQQVDRYGAAVDAAEREELADLLGCAIDRLPRTHEEREAELEDFVLAAGPEHDAVLVRFFRRRLQREELLLEPALGYLRGSTIPPID
jgi:hypothetical protein